MTCHRFGFQFVDVKKNADSWTCPEKEIDDQSRPSMNRLGTPENTLFLPFSLL